MTTYTLYIDESGETGIARVRTDWSRGASPYLTMGAVLTRDDNKVHLKGVLEEVLGRFQRSDLHCNRLNHRQKVYFAQRLAEQEVVLFGLISLKATLAEYRERIAEDNVKYYNKCAGYLLECVGDFMTEKQVSTEDMSVVFEEGHHDYGRFRSYLAACQNTPIHQRARLLQKIDLRRVIDRPKVDEPLLQLADLTAHSIYQAVNKSDNNYQTTELRYLEELHKRFYCDPVSKNISPRGLKPIKGIANVGLDRESREIISGYEGEMALPRA